LLVCLLWCFFADARAERPYFANDIFDKLHKMEGFYPSKLHKMESFATPKSSL
jgi:hypothetical protein